MKTGLGVRSGWVLSALLALGCGDEGYRSEGGDPGCWTPLQGPSPDGSSAQAGCSCTTPYQFVEAAFHERGWCLPQVGFGEGVFCQDGRWSSALDGPCIDSVTTQQCAERGGVIEDDGALQRDGFHVRRVADDGGIGVQAHCYMPFDVARADCESADMRVVANEAEVTPELRCPSGEAPRAFVVAGSARHLCCR